MEERIDPNKIRKSWKTRSQRLVFKAEFHKSVLTDVVLKCLM